MSVLGRTSTEATKVGVETFVCSEKQAEEIGTDSLHLCKVNSIKVLFDYCMCYGWMSNAATGIISLYGRLEMEGGICHVARKADWPPSEIVRRCSPWSCAGGPYKLTTPVVCARC